MSHTGIFLPFQREFEFSGVVQRADPLGDVAGRDDDFRSLVLLQTSRVRASPGR